MAGLLLTGDSVYLTLMGESEEQRKNIVVGKNFRVLGLGSSVL